MSVDLKEIEKQAFGLPDEKRAELMQKLLLNLETPSEAEIAINWLLEAHRRARELDEGAVQTVTAEEVRRPAWCAIAIKEANTAPLPIEHCSNITASFRA